MRRLRAVVKIAAGVVGPIVGIVKPSIEYIQARQPMSFLEWFAVLVIVASTVYGLYEFTAFLMRLHRRTLALERIGADGRLNQMYEWWMDSTSLDLLACRVLRSQDKPK